MKGAFKLLLLALALIPLSLWQFFFGGKNGSHSSAPLFINNVLADTPSPEGAEGASGSPESTSSGTCVDVESADSSSIA